MTQAADTSAKAIMRAHVRTTRRAFIREHPEADWQAADHVEEMLAGLRLTKPGVIALYKSSGSEIDPRPVAEAMLKLGWRLALPACEALDAPVVFRAWTPGDRLAPDAAEISAPLASAGEVIPDIIVAPLLAFDWVGGRLGQGGGYYDRTLAALRRQPNPPAFVGLAFSCQEVDQVPREEHDEKLDAILTEKGYRPLP